MNRYLGGYLKDTGGLSNIEDDTFFLYLPVFNREIPGLLILLIDRLDKLCLPKLIGLLWTHLLACRPAGLPCPGARRRLAPRRPCNDYKVVTFLAEPSALRFPNILSFFFANILLPCERLVLRQPFIPVLFIFNRIIRRY